MIKQIIMNMYGTMLPMDGTAVLRNGLEGFLDKHEDKEIVVMSRASRERAEEDLKKVGLLDGVTLYSKEIMPKMFTHSMFPDEYKGDAKAMEKYIKGCLSGGPESANDPSVRIPPLRIIHYDTGVTLKDSALISDFYLDIDDGTDDRVGRIFKVPVFENVEKDSFSFDRVKLYSAQALWSGLKKFHNFSYREKLK